MWRNENFIMRFCGNKIFYVEPNLSNQKKRRKKKKNLSNPIFYPSYPTTYKPFKELSSQLSSQLSSHLIIVVPTPHHWYVHHFYNCKPVKVTRKYCCTIFSFSIFYC